MSAMSSIGKLQSQFIEKTNRYLEEDAEDDLSFDDTPYCKLSSRSRDLYNNFINQLNHENINYIDTFAKGLSCIMVYPSESVELSCIFVPYVDRDAIEIKICKSNCDINKIMKSLPRDVYKYCDDIVRSKNIQSVTSWMKTLF